ncbi:DNA polymerase I [soil metagenome]
MSKTVVKPTEKSKDRRKRLVLVDGHGLAFRAFFALPPSLATASGEITNATFGFTSMLLDVLRSHKPDYLLVTFDVGRTFRHDSYADYKAHRAPMPEELKPQLDRIREVLTALNVPVYEAEGFEADDVIGTLSRQAGEQGYEAYVVTGDSDLLQLVDDHVSVVMPGAQRFGEYRMFDRDAVLERYGFGPERVAEYKALVGDKSDNIPGVPGIGDKTAKALIGQFASLDELLSQTEAIAPPRARNAIENNRESALQSLELATIVRDVPVELEIERCTVHDYDREGAIALFRELEFRTLPDRLPDSSRLTDGDGTGSQSSGQQANWKLATSESELNELAEQIRNAPHVAVDVETDGTHPVLCGLVGIAIATSETDACYIPLRHSGGPNADPERAREIIGTALRAHKSIVAHHGKFDLAVLNRHGYEGITIEFDTMLAAYLLGETTYGLKDLTFQRLGWQMTPITDLIGRGKTQTTMDQIEAPRAAEYATADVEATLRLCPAFREELKARDQEDLLRSIELPLIPVLVKMERTGIALDTELLKDLSNQLEGQIGELKSTTFEAVGHEFNINSPAQLANVLYEEIGLPSGRKTKTGYSVSQDVLENLRGAHDAVDAVLEYRALTKLKSTYVDALPNQVSPESGRIHTTYNQTIAATGRLSSVDPNLQNIPVRSAVGRRVRRAFVADNREGKQPFDEETVFLGADYSQMELRMMAHYSQDPALVDAFREGQDIHATTAAEVFDVPVDEVTSNQRSTAKAVNFGIMYGMQAYGVSRDTGMSRSDAQSFIERYMERFQGVRKYLDSTLEQAVRDGYVSSLYGRRRYLPDIATRGPRRQGAERAAVNMPLQGTAADIMKIAMLDVDSELAKSKLQGRMLLQVHDELIFETPLSEVESLSELVRRVMTDAAKLSVPLGVDTSCGPNWDEMTPLDV